MAIKEFGRFIAVTGKEIQDDGEKSAAEKLAAILSNLVDEGREVQHFQVFGDGSSSRPYQAIIMLSR